MTDAVTQLYKDADQLKAAGDSAGAIAKLNEVLAIDPGHVLSHLALAVLYFRVKEYERSVEHGRKACELDPNDAFNFTALSVTYQRAWQGTHKQEYIQLAEDAMARAHMLQGR